MEAASTTRAALPLEILIGLLPLLNLKDLKSFRRCNKALAQDGARLLFHTIVVLNTYASFMSLRSVSDNPKLRLCVRRVDYVANRFQEGLSMDEWIHHYSQGQEDRLNAVVYLRRPYEAYVDISQEQFVGFNYRSLDIVCLT